VIKSSRFNIDNLLLFFILLTGSILRLYHVSDIPLVHDELSALSEIFHSFKDLMEKGVGGDVHPPLVRIFLNYWAMLLGYNEVWIKLPFILCGILSIYFVYRVGMLWFNNSTIALAASAFFCALEYSVMYSQIARPYIPGVLFSLLMVYCWTQWYLQEQRTNLKYVAGFIFFSTLACYSHYFSLLFFILVYVTGFFILKRKQMGKYLLSGLVVFVLFIPYLKIFLYQLSRGGVGGANGWLGTPSYVFLSDYFKYVLHYSFGMYLLFLILVSALLLKKYSVKYYRFTIIGISWFFATFLIGFYYSRFVNPVLQNSSLLFSFPFLILSLFSGLNFGKSWQRVLLVISILTISTYSLSVNRKYYHLFYKSQYEQLVLESQNAAEKYGKENCSFLFETNKRYVNFYIKKHKAEDLNISFLQRGQPLNLISDSIQSLSTKYFILCIQDGSPSELYSIVKNYYPYTLTHQSYFFSDFYLFSKEAGNNLNEIYFSSINNFEKNIPYWSSFDSTNTKLLSDGKAYKMDSAKERSIEFQIPLEKVLKHENDWLDIRAQIFAEDSFSNANIICAIDNHKKHIAWRVMSFNQFNKPKAWFTVFYSMSFDDIYSENKDAILKVFILNDKRQNFLVRDFSVNFRKGNPYKFGIYREIKEREE
jgi:hypothetical protein